MDPKFLEELSLNNWQPLSTLLYDGWILRFAEGYTKRANSINPIYDSTYDVDLKIAECEHIYATNHLPTVFKISPFVHPANLDDILETKGYSILDTTSIQTLDLDHVMPPTLATVTIEEQFTDTWLDNFCRLNQVEEHNKKTMKQLLSNIKTKKAFISLQHEEQIIACGLGVIEREYIGLYDIVTDVHYRNRGFGKQLILNLLQWGKDHGAKYSYLAVVMNNAPALHLYSELGFQEKYNYWYRVKS